MNRLFAPRGVAMGLALGSLLGAAPLQAQVYVPSLSCEASDFSMELKLYLILTGDGTGAPGPAGMQGTVRLHHQKIDKDRRYWSLDGKRPAQFWNRDGQLKIMLVFGGGGDPITIVLETAQQLGGTEYSGAFRVIAPGVKLTGRLACSVG